MNGVGKSYTFYLVLPSIYIIFALQKKHIMVQNLDEIDIRILRVMQENCRITTKELAARIHLSTTATYERLRRLEVMGIFHGYVAVLDAEKLERGFVVFCNIAMSHINQDIVREFTERIQEWPEVSECYNVSGEFDYMLKVFCKSMDMYQQFVVRTIGTLEHVCRVQSVFVMDTLKLTYGIKI